MIAIFILFCLSGLGIAALFAHKLYELKKGTTLISVGVREKADAVVQTALHEHRDMVIRKSKSAIRLSIISLKKSTYNVSLFLLHKIHAELTRLLERMKGRTSVRTSARKNPQNKGSVSFFLKNVGEYKKEIKDGSVVKTKTDSFS